VGFVSEPSLGTGTWPDGQVFVGDWKNDKREGRGTLTYGKCGLNIRGKVEQGQWKDGHLVSSEPGVFGSSPPKYRGRNGKKSKSKSYATRLLSGI